jgi:hypothetical protein
MWMITWSRASSTGECGHESGGSATFEVDDSGTFKALDVGISGAIDVSSGSVAFSLAGDPDYDGVLRTCPPGSGSGICSSFQFCAGTFSQGGEGPWTLTR